MRFAIIAGLTRVLLRTAVVACATTGLLQAQDEDGGGARRQRVTMDSARISALYVSKDPADHPVADYARAVARKAVTDSIFAARSVGVMKFSKVKYTSPVDGLEIPASVFEPLTSRGARTQPALVWVHGGVHGNWDQNYLPFIIEAVKRGYVIIAPDYRGSTGYGRSSTSASTTAARKWTTCWPACRCCAQTRTWTPRASA